VNLILIICRIEEAAQDINDYEDMVNNMREILSQNDSVSPSTVDTPDQEVPEEIEEQENQDELENQEQESGYSPPLFFLPHAVFNYY
jgi:hypothetical protein